MVAVCLSKVHSSIILPLLAPWLSLIFRCLLGQPVLHSESSLSPVWVTGRLAQWAGWGPGCAGVPGTRSRSRSCGPAAGCSRDWTGSQWTPWCACESSSGAPLYTGTASRKYHYIIPHHMKQVSVNVVLCHCFSCVTAAFKILVIKSCQIRQNPWLESTNNDSPPHDESGIYFFLLYYSFIFCTYPDPSICSNAV